MASRSRKLPIGSAGAKPHLTINEADWQRIETKYGKQLPARLRKAARSNASLVEFEVFERTVEPAAGAEAIFAGADLQATPP